MGKILVNEEKLINLLIRFPLVIDGSKNIPQWCGTFKCCNCIFLCADGCHCRDVSILMKWLEAECSERVQRSDHEAGGHENEY